MEDQVIESPLTVPLTCQFCKSTTDVKHVKKFIYDEKQQRMVLDEAWFKCINCGIEFGTRVERPIVYFNLKNPKDVRYVYY